MGGGQWPMTKRPIPPCVVTLGGAPPPSVCGSREGWVHGMFLVGGTGCSPMVLHPSVRFVEDCLQH